MQHSKINSDDLQALTKQFISSSQLIHDRFCDELKDTQDHAYQLGLKRGLEIAQSRKSRQHEILEWACATFGPDTADVTGEIEVSSFIQPKEATLMLENNARIIKHKVGLLNLAEELGNVSKACKVIGLSRDTFYRYKAAVESGDFENLFDKSPSATKTDGSSR